MFYYGAFTMPGCIRVRAGRHSSLREETILSLLSGNTIKRIVDMNVKVILPSDLAVRSNVSGLSWDQIIASVLTTTDVGPLLAISINGVGTQHRRLSAMGHKPKQINVIVESYFVHEAVHVEQVRSKRLVELPNGVIYWEGYEWTPTMIAKEGYDNLPWEKEAEMARRKFLCEN